MMIHQSARATSTGWCTLCARTHIGWTPGPGIRNCPMMADWRGKKFSLTGNKDVFLKPAVHSLTLVATTIGLTCSPTS